MGKYNSPARGDCLRAQVLRHRRTFLELRVQNVLRELLALVQTDLRLLAPLGGQAAHVVGPSHEDFEDLGQPGDLAEELDEEQAPGAFGHLRTERLPEVRPQAPDVFFPALGDPFTLLFDLGQVQRVLPLLHVFPF